MQPIHQKVLATIKRYAQLSPGEGVVIAVSGGADSMALLCLFTDLVRSGLLDVRLFVASLNHGLRKNAAARDIAFVKAAAAARGIRCLTRTCQVERYCRTHRLSLEEGARQLRYAFFGQACRHFGVTTVATAHTLNDQAETVLMRLLTGTGLTGAGGIHPVMTHPGGIRVIRPLLDVTRSEIESFLGRSHCTWREDRTNRDTRFLRNRIRQTVLPACLSINPRAYEALARFAGISRVISDDMAARAEKSYQKLCLSTCRGVVAIDRRGWCRLPASERGEIFRLIVRDLTGGQGAAFTQWAELDALLLRNDAGKRVFLPGGFQVVLEQQRAVFMSRGRMPAQPLSAAQVLTVPGETDIGNRRYRFSARYLSRRNAAVHLRAGKGSEVYFDAGRLRFPLRVRSRRPADRINPFGMTGTRRVKKVMIDARVPVTERDRLPLVCSGGTIIWIPGVLRSAMAPVTRTTRKVLCLNVAPGPGSAL